MLIGCPRLNIKNLWPKHVRSKIIECGSISSPIYKNSILIRKHCYCSILLEKCNKKITLKNQIVRNHFRKQLKTNFKNVLLENLKSLSYIERTATGKN